MMYPVHHMMYPVHHMMDPPIHHIMDRVHHMMDGVHHMMDLHYIIYCYYEKTLFLQTSFHQKISQIQKYMDVVKNLKKYVILTGNE